jgi:hypothetical protein
MHLSSLNVRRMVGIEMKIAASVRGFPVNFG